MATSSGECTNNTVITKSRGGWSQNDRACEAHLWNYGILDYNGGYYMY